MAEEEENGRHYWQYMQSPNSPFKFPKNAPCPFSHSLYQLMRNQVLAIALVQKTSVGWAEFGVCIHSGNTRVRQLSEAVWGQTDALQAFTQLLPTQQVLEIDPLRVMQIARKNDPACSEWADWMITRYELHKVAVFSSRPIITSCDLESSLSAQVLAKQVDDADPPIGWPPFQISREPSLPERLRRGQCAQSRQSSE
jgi:hypothetical protein